MLDHLGLQVHDVQKSLDFYLHTFGPIGMREIVRFWLGPPDGPETRELHVAFKAPDRVAVDAVHAAAVAVGAEVLHAPRKFPEYHPGYYGVFLRDLDGLNRGRPARTTRQS